MQAGTIKLGIQKKYLWASV